MKKQNFLVLLLFHLISLTQVFGQNTNLETDTLQNYLVKKCKELLKPHSNLTFSFGTEELSNVAPDLNVVIPELKDSAKYIEDLKGDYSDWQVFHQIGKLYQRYAMQKPAYTYFEQAYNLIVKQIGQDSMNHNLYADLASLYLDLNNQQNAFYCLQKAYELDGKDSLASSLLPMLYINMGEIEKADKIIDKNIHDGDNQIITYIWKIFSNVLKPLSQLDSNNTDFRNKTIDDIFDFSAVDEAIKQNKPDISFQMLEQLGRQLALFAKYAAISNNNIKEFSLTDKDLKELKSIRKTLEKYISKKEFKNKYVLYKALGFNYLLEKNTSKAVELIQKAMTLWPSNKVTSDYYILFSIRYFLQNDTMAALTTIDKKIKNDIDLLMLNANDYSLKGSVLLAKNEYKGASDCFHKALESGNMPDAWLGLAFLAMKDLKLEEANKLINNAYELDKQNYLCYALFAVITILNNQLSDAKVALEKAIELKPDDETIKELYDDFFKSSEK